MVLLRVGFDHTSRLTWAHPKASWWGSVYESGSSHQSDQTRLSWQVSWQSDVSTWNDKEIHEHRPQRCQEHRHLSKLQRPFLTSRSRLLVERSLTGCPGQEYRLGETPVSFKDRWQLSQWRHHSEARSGSRWIRQDSNPDPPTVPSVYTPSDPLFANTPTIMHSLHWLNPQAITPVGQLFLRCLHQVIHILPTYH